MIFYSIAVVKAGWSVWAGEKHPSFHGESCRSAGTDAAPNGGSRSDESNPTPYYGIASNPTA